MCYNLSNVSDLPIVSVKGIAMSQSSQSACHHVTHHAEGLPLPSDGLEPSANHSHLQGLPPKAIEQRIATAKASCASQGSRFTPLREQVFRLILQSPKPIGAYDLLALLQKTSEKTLAPPTIYRSLDFLLANGFIHQLSSSNAFFPCCQPDDSHTAAFLICQKCGDVQEFSHHAVTHVLADVANGANFRIHTSVIELLGICQRCQD